MTSAVRIEGVGLACPVGLHARAAAAAVRAGVSRFLERADVAGRDGSVRASMLEAIPRAASRTERALWFARRALAEALTGRREGAGSMPCFLALPEPDELPRLSAAAVVAALAEVRTGEGAPVELAVAPAQVIAAGRAGCFQALMAASAALASGATRQALVVGMDSQVDAATLQALADRNRVLGRSNLDGTIPGEGAACLLLERSDAGQRRPPLVVVQASVAGHEPRPLHSLGPEISASTGLSAVFRALHAAVGGRVDDVIAATTGQGFFGREFSHAYLRNASLMPEPLRHACLASTLGDVGAAAGAIAAVLAVLGRERSTLVYGSSDTGLVGGCVITRG